MNDLDAKSLDADLLELLAAERSVEPPPDGAASRVFASVSARIANGSGGGAGGSSFGGEGTPARGAGGANRARALASLAGAFALGGATAVTVLLLARRPAESVRVVFVDRPTQAPAGPARTEVLPRSSSLAEDPEVVAPSSLPLAPSPLARPASVAPRPTAKATAQDRLAAERALLDVARRGLATGEPVKALAAVERHEKEYAQGVLTEEREAIAVKALVAAGRGEDARARGATFRARYPRSIMLNAVQSSLKTIP